MDAPLDAPSSDNADGPSKATATADADAAASEATAAVAVDRDVEHFRLQVVAELIRMHVAAVNKACADPAAGTPTPAVVIDADTIEAHLDLPLQSVAEQAEAADPGELEVHNLRLKPYLKQLNALKAALTAQLRELEESRAFIALGISKEASEAMIKKAYHSKAIKLHPDKPGGDTAKFQQLQASYHEILKKKAEAAELEREDAAEAAAEAGQLTAGCGLRRIRGGIAGRRCGTPARGGAGRRAGRWRWRRSHAHGANTTPRPTCG